MFGLTLAAALLTADAKVRASEEFALAGQLAVFPCREAMQRNFRLANEHLDYLKGQLDLGPVATWITQDDVDAQSWVLNVYRNLEDARFWSGLTFNGWHRDEWWEGSDDESNEHARYVELTKDRMGLLREKIGREAFTFGRLPAPLPCMSEPWR